MQLLVPLHFKQQVPATGTESDDFLIRQVLLQSAETDNVGHHTMSALPLALSGLDLVTRADARLLPPPRKRKINTEGASASKVRILPAAAQDIFSFTINTLLLEERHRVCLAASSFHAAAYMQRSGIPGGPVTRRGRVVQEWMYMHMRREMT